MPTDASSKADTQLEVSLPENDARHPFNLSQVRKLHIVWTEVSWGFNSNLGSSLPSGASKQIAEHFQIVQHEKLVLLNSLYMCGYAFGGLVYGPLSEHFGRRPMLVGSYLGYTMFTLGCALSPNFTALLIFRFLCGINAATPHSITGALYSDILPNPTERGRAMAYFSVAGTVGPQLGPLISGLVAPISWRWPFWIGLILAIVGLPFMVMLPETYAPIIAAKQAKIDGKPDPSLQVSFTVQLRKLRDDLLIALARPFVMITSEMILVLVASYVALVYGMLYLYFQAYPVVFQGLYGLPSGEAGLAFLPSEFRNGLEAGSITNILEVIAGTFIAFFFFMWYNSYYTKAVAEGKEWAKVEEYRRLPPACIGGPLIVISIFWLGWTARSDIHPIVPMLSGVFFGTGSLTIFMAMIIYLTDVYKTRSAPANAAASALRSIFAVCLPFAARPMYHNLGVQWASSLLGLVALLMGLIPFWFLKSGGKIRRKSRFATNSEHVSVIGVPPARQSVVSSKGFPEERIQKLTAEFEIGTSTSVSEVQNKDGTASRRGSAFIHGTA